MYGETPCPSEPSAAHAGLSPRVRGTFSSLAQRSHVIGLSPRVRGNRVRYVVIGAKVRSIPACTGKPPDAPSLLSARTVYPRVYGETHAACLLSGMRGGLSPRVRGNQGLPTALPVQHRSIPACVDGQRKCPAKWPAKMSLELLAMITDGSYPPRSRFMGGLTASMYFFAVSRWMASSRATLRIDRPLRFAFCTAFHLAV